MVKPENDRAPSNTRTRNKSNNKEAIFPDFRPNGFVDGRVSSERVGLFDLSGGCWYVREFVEFRVEILLRIKKANKNNRIDISNKPKITILVMLTVRVLIFLTLLYRRCCHSGFSETQSRASELVCVDTAESVTADCGSGDAAATEFRDIAIREKMAPARNMKTDSIGIDFFIILSLC